MVVVQLLFRWHEVDGTEHNIAQCGLTAQALYSWSRSSGPTADHRDGIVILATCKILKEIYYEKSLTNKWIAAKMVIDVVNRSGHYFPDRQPATYPPEFLLCT